MQGVRVPGEGYLLIGRCERLSWPVRVRARVRSRVQVRIHVSMAVRAPQVRPLPVINGRTIKVEIFIHVNAT